MQRKDLFASGSYKVEGPIAPGLIDDAELPLTIKGHIITQDKSTASSDNFLRLKFSSV